MDEYTRLEKLMTEKSFADLSQKEKTWVEQYLSATDYEAQREIIVNMQRERPPLPPRAMEVDLMQAFRNHHTPVVAPIWPQMGKYLLWAAALMGVFFLGRWSQLPDISVPDSAIVNTIYKIKKDTIYIEKEIPKIAYIKTLVRDTIYIEKAYELPIATANTNQELMPILELGDLQQYSSKVKDDEDIYKILVDVY